MKTRMKATMKDMMILVASVESLRATATHIARTNVLPQTRTKTTMELLPTKYTVLHHKTTYPHLCLLKFLHLAGIIVIAIEETNMDKVRSVYRHPIVSCVA
jgi:hypothetical protein